MLGYYVGTTLGSIAILITLVILFIFWLKNRTFKKRIKQIGQTAEDKINADIKVWSRKTKNHFIPASLYKYNNNKVFEVDSILITDKALIVIEIKSIKGGIKGDATQTKWQKVLGSVTHPVSNPIIQNEGHINHIIKMTGSKVPTISLIVYSDRSTFLDVSNRPSHVIVTKHSGLFESLDKIDAALKVSMSDYDSKTLTAIIKKYRTNKRADIKLHKNITTKGHA